MSDPLTDRQREYREVYLRSEHWVQVRAGALDRADHRCVVCNSTDGLDVHHRTYERLGCERPADVTVLCRACHDTFHAEHKLTRSQPRSTIPTHVGLLSPHAVWLLEQSVPRANELWLIARDCLQRAPWSTAGQVVEASGVPRGRAYADWAYRVLVAAHEAGYVERRNVPYGSGERYHVEWALTATATKRPTRRRRSKSRGKGRKR